MIHRGTRNPELPLEERALKLPVVRAAEERQVFVPWLAAVDEDPRTTVATRAKGFCRDTDDTRAVRDAMLAEIRGCARRPQGAVPLAGRGFAPAGAHRGTSVEVSVERQ